MKRTTALGAFIAALAVVFIAAQAPGAFAQDPKGGGGGGSSPRGGGGGGGGGGERGGGTVSSAPAPAPSSGGSSGGAPVWTGGGMSGGNSGMSAVPRGGGRVNDGGGRQPNGVGPRWTAGGAGAAAREGRPADRGAFGRSPTDDQVAGRSRAGNAMSGVESSAPWYSRPRGGNPATGAAVPRPEVPVTGPPGGGGGGYPGYPDYPGYPGYGGGYWNGYYDCYYYPYGCGNPWGYGGFGLGYFYYNPFGWNYGDFGYWGGGGGGGGGSYGGQQMGSIRLKVKPNNASVYVDGYYAGTVDDFDNAFQKLSLALGPHRIEISAPGYQPLVFEIDVRDFDTIDYQGRLEPIR
jgi:hypothetical protein